MTGTDDSGKGARLAGSDDPKNPDALITVEQAENPPSRTAYGHEETDTLEVENNEPPAEPVRVPEQNGITGADTVGGTD